MKPICVPCQRFYRPDKNGVVFIEGMPVNNAKPGLAEPENWNPYKIWCGDRWKCPDCSAIIIVGVGQSPISEQYLEEFEQCMITHAPELQVNDC